MSRATCLQRLAVGFSSSRSRSAVYGRPRVPGVSASGGESRAALVRQDEDVLNATPKQSGDSQRVPGRGKVCPFLPSHDGLPGHPQSACELGLIETQCSAAFLDQVQHLVRPGNSRRPLWLIMAFGRSTPPLPFGLRRGSHQRCRHAARLLVRTTPLRGPSGLRDCRFFSPALEASEFSPARPGPPGRFTCRQQPDAETVWSARRALTWDKARCRRRPGGVGLREEKRSNALKRIMVTRIATSRSGVEDHIKDRSCIP